MANQGEDPLADGALGAPPDGRETQASVTAWTDVHYPAEIGDLFKKVLNLVEEVGELSSELGYDPERMARHFLASARRPARGGDPRDIEGAAGEVGDNLLAIYEVAQAMKVDAHDCLNRKMSGKNRLKSPEQSASRAAAKRAKGL